MNPVRYKIMLINLSLYKKSAIFLKLALSNPIYPINPKEKLKYTAINESTVPAKIIMFVCNKQKMQW
jgi:hypothetical protein